ncbi:hypothetical protein Pcinc_034940 [Petrolisthes cinctipes]|uniref:Uncharacterized protein n=1 Tax=Petrolisthes cinctipes TaxID=88211 RepID=A0AAE1EPY9_PETCI|nr:hypothetical protein Pcinc_034940 [Petrolisthes cinctipes]
MDATSHASVQVAKEEYSRGKGASVQEAKEHDLRGQRKTSHRSIKTVRRKMDHRVYCCCRWETDHQREGLHTAPDPAPRTED